MNDGSFRFGKHCLDWERRELTRDGQVVAAEPRVLELLRFLIINRERAVGKDELAEALWPDRVISDTVISQIVRKARKAVGDDGDRQATIATVRGFGYRFVATITDPLEAGESGIETGSPEDHRQRSTRDKPGRGSWAPGRRWSAFIGLVVLLALGAGALFGPWGSGGNHGFNPVSATTDRPVLVAMLPFFHDHSSVRDRALAQSLTEALHMRLASISGIEIRSPRIVDIIADNHNGLAQLIAEAQVDFLLSGTLEPAMAADRRELELELIHYQGGSLQATPLGRFSLPFPESSESLSEFMARRDTIIQRLTETLIPALQPDLDRDQTGTASPEAFRLLLAAIRAVRAVQCDSQTVEDLLGRAIDTDPAFDHARMALAWVRYAQFRNCGESPQALVSASEQLEIVLARNANHPVALLINTLIEIESGRIEAAYARAAAALDQHPTSPQLRLSLAHALTHAGFLEAAADYLDALVASDPLFLSFEKPHLPTAYLYQNRLDDFLDAAPSLDAPLFRYYRAVASLGRGDEPAARVLLEPATRGDPTDRATRMSEALLAILDDRPDAAVAIVEELGSTSSDSPLINPEALFQLGRLLAQAGEPDRAIEMFERSLDSGFFCAACLDNDKELTGLLEHPGWTALVGSARQRQQAMAERFDLPGKP